NEKYKERISPPDSRSDVREAEEKEIGEMILSYLKEAFDANKQESIIRFDKNDWSNDTSEEKKEIKGDDLSHIKDNSEEKKETKWDSIDWSKDNSEVKEETKWDSINWSKNNSELKEETKWDNIDWSKDYSSEEKKIEGSKNDNIDDNIMTSGEDNEKIEHSNLNEKKSDDNDDELSRQIDFDENNSDDEYHKKNYEGINDYLEEKGKEHEIIGNNENDYESNLSREGTETLLSPSEHPEELLEQVNEYEPKNNSEHLLDRKTEEIDEFELVTPEGKPEKPAEPPEIMELVEEGSYNSDYSSEQKFELSSEIEAQKESENPLEEESLNESEDRSKEELGKELELINPETGESIPPQPGWEFIPLQDYLEQLHEQQENRDEINEIESEQEREKIPDQESELNSEQESDVKSYKGSKNSFDQKSELISEQESEYRLNHNHIQRNKIEHITENENDSITDSKKSRENKHHDYKQLIKTKYEPIFSQTQLRKAQTKTEKSDKEIKISQKTENKNGADKIKEKDLNADSTLLRTIEERNNVKIYYSSEQNQRLSKNRSENGENIEISKKLKEQKQEKLKENQKIEFISSELLELQEMYRQETRKRPIYNKKQTKGFKEWLENQKESTIKQSQSNRKREIREEWEILLQKWIKEANERDISQKVKEELLNIIKKYRQCRRVYKKLVQLSNNKDLTRKELEEIEDFFQKLEETSKIQTEIFKNLRAFRSFYNENIRWYKHQITAEKQKFLNHLSQKLNHLKETKNPQKKIKKKWKELLKENLYKNTTLNYRDKSLIDKILQKEKLTEQDKKELISLLSKLSIDELILLLGNEFKKHTQNYIKWGWDYDIGVKKLILNSYLMGSRTLEVVAKNDRYRNPPSTILLEEYVKNVVDQYVNKVKTRQKQLKLGVGLPFITLKNKKMKNVYLNRHLYDYFGIIYRIIEVGTGRILYGLTLDSVNNRWSNYKRFAEKSRHSQNILPIEVAILQAKDSGNDVDQSFIIKPVEICFDLHTLRAREDFWIRRHETMNPTKGLNSRGGGGGGPKTIIPIDILIKYIARGYHISEIKKALVRNHGMFLGRKTVSRRINEYFGSYHKAQTRFFKPVLEQLLKEGYNSNDIIAAFKTRGRNIVDRLIPKFFGVSTFRDARRLFLINILEDLIIQGLGQKAMADKLEGFGLTEIYNAIKDEWGNLKEAQKALWRPVIIQRFKEGWKGREILVSLGYSSNTIRVKYNEIFERLFWGMTMNQVKNFAINFLLHPLDGTEFWS
ncbi:MAG: hypothetical protein ACFFC3_08120, partial [Candidatus Odinarchaeota archaeon]